MKLTAELAKELFEYDAASGHLTWKCRDEVRHAHLHTTTHSMRRWNSRMAGVKAGRCQMHGYIVINFQGRIYREHRLVFLIHYGRMPVCLDHINGVRDDNRIENLREATHQENCFNMRLSKRNATGFKGVSYHTKRQRYVACMRHDGKQLHVGYFKSAEEAACEIRAVRERIHGKFANHG